ncbi:MULTISPECIES: hypothetical protein [unclassified Prevotella]|jgi:hypothetical protein|uniref:hypothetical protein n=1 Tax=Prevotella sp. oral taxon 306 TaxID=712461 RepID=UPI00025BCE52|nr:hypothetical protein [Prevotella sp. oral taxon 306]EID33286.1 hypothetical protein HMPREF9969_0008 [Prevotella sp. oral taxon 306 str. F0472]
MSIDNITKTVFVLVLFFALSGCTIKKEPFSPSLQYVLNQFSKEHPEYNVIQIQVSKINNYNLLFMTGLGAYDPDMIDGYYIYNGKLITYFQTDSLDRTHIVDTKVLKKYSGKIDGYRNVFQSKGITEPIQRAFFITNENRIVRIPKGFSLLSKGGYVDTNVIKNTGLKKFLHNYIENAPSVLYELRFKQEKGKQYVIFRPMIFYDSSKLNGYFFWNGHLIVLYDLKQSGDLLNKQNILHSHKIPNYRSLLIDDWNFPYPIKLEIINDEAIKELSLEEGYFL